MSSPYWDQATIRAALEELLAGEDTWPSYREFVRRGARPLRDAVTRTGGARAWASKLGVTYVQRSPGYAPRWTDERIRAELGEFLSGREHWPRRVAFEAAGRKDLRDAIQRRGGIDQWTAEFGLAVPDHLRGSLRAWPDDEVQRQLTPLVRKLGRWPTKAEFRRAGLFSMLTALYRYGTVGEWQRRLDVAPAAPRGHVPDATRWTDERILAELRAFCAGRGTWPTEWEFYEAGLRALYRAASRRGGVDRWKALLGLSDRMPTER